MSSFLHVLIKCYCEEPMGQNSCTVKLLLAPTITFSSLLLSAHASIFGLLRFRQDSVQTSQWFVNCSDSRIDSVRFANEFFKSFCFCLTAANRKVICEESWDGFFLSSEWFKEQSSLNKLIVISFQNRLTIAGFHRKRHILLLRPAHTSRTV